MSLMERRSFESRRRRVTEEDVKCWIEAEEFEQRCAAEMVSMEHGMGTGSEVRSKHPAHGSVPNERPDGVFRGMVVQLNGMVTNQVKNRKARMLRAAVRKYDVQFVGLGEVGVNFKKANKKRLLSLLPDLGLNARSTTAHNQHENIAIHQQGGVGTIVLGELLNYYKKGCNDFRKLGRWTSFILQSVQGHRTRVVQCYAVRAVRSKEIGSVYQQHLRYIQHNGLGNVSPRELFETDLCWQLQVWRALGDRIILMMDANCHVLTGKLSRALTDESIGLREITKDHLQQLCPNTHASGSEQIDGVWCSSDITITAVKWLTYEESPGDHRASVFDFTTLSAIGSVERKISLPQCRRLISTNPGAVESYTGDMDKQWDIHRIDERLDAIDEATQGVFPIPEEYQILSERLDKQTIEIQIHCENRCRIIYRPDSAFSPDFSIWHKRYQIFKQLIRMQENRVRNTGILCKKARKLGIEAPRQWSIEECRHGLAICKAWKRKLHKYAPALRKEHLQDLLLDAEANKDTERAKAIREMMDREESKSMWSQLNYTFKDNGGRSNAVTRVERMENGEVVEYTQQEEIEQVVREETQHRFTLAASSPLCNDLLGDQLGYIADTEVATAILNGTFVPPDNVSDATLLVLEEISRIAAEIRRGEVDLNLTDEQFTMYWKAINEHTSSSRSRVHFGHYKVAAMSKRLSKYFAKKLTFIGRTGWAPERWGTGLTVLLEKIAGIALVNKLRAILLFEADSNMFNSYVFGKRAMEVARQHNLIPPEQYAARQSDGQDGAWLKRLFADISRQLKIPIGIVSADAEQCYDRIAHVCASLVFQAVGVLISAIMVMLLSIQNMKFYLRTGLGESAAFMSAVIGSIIQGLCQGNTAAPAGWSLISAVILKVYKLFGHGAHLTSPITRRDSCTAGVLFVDDVDLFTMNSALTSPELWEEAAISTETWTELLTVTGGSGKGEKCFGHLLDYEWDCCGNWSYAPVPDMELKIVLPDGSKEGIALLPHTSSRVTLGISTSPDGDDLSHLTKPGQARDKWRSVATRANVWLDRLKNGHLPSKFSWVSYRLQLWSSIRYGLGTLSAPLCQLGELTRNFAHRALPYLGVNRNIRSGWRYLHSSFGGVGLLSLSTESVISRINMFLQHWGMPTPIGDMLEASMEALQLEAGCVGCPLNENFYPMGQITTHCWLRSFWEMIDRYKLHLELTYPPIPLPRQNDAAIMSLAMTMFRSIDDLRSINRCRLYSCCIFLSDMADATGKRLDATRGQQDTDYSISTKYTFPRECPCARDWEVWESFWNTYLLPDGTLPRALGKWTSSTHRIWEWYYSPASDMLVQQVGNVFWAYLPCAEVIEQHTRGTQKYARVGRWGGTSLIGLLPTSVRLCQDYVLHLNPGNPGLTRPVATSDTDFWSSVRSFGGEWLWEHTHTPLGIDALVDAIADGSAILVTDGSYFRNVRPDVDGAGWLVYCKIRRKIVFEGSCFEQNAQAGSYRGELLGLLAMHVLILAVEKFYGLTSGPRGLVACDNLGGLNKSKERRKKIPSSAKHADILRSLRRAHSMIQGSVEYKHVYGHQDRRKKKSQLTLLERLNTKCDSLAKLAVSNGILTCIGQMSAKRQTLPLESVALFYCGCKISGECGAEIRFQVGKVEARQFYLTQLGWYAATFDNVDWISRDKALARKPDMFKMWLCKQTSSFCASGKNMGRWFGSEHTSCPNCGTADEDSRHLLHCTDAGRFALFRTELDSLSAWLQQNHTDPLLARVLREYIFARGEKSLSSFQLPLPYQKFAHAQDLIGWDNFMVGMISTHLRPLQYNHLLNSPSVLTVEDWMKQFITKLLHLVHGQWIYRNISKHHDSLGSIRKAERKQLLLEIDRLTSLTPEEVPDESKFLLEMDFERLKTSDSTTQNYWVHAIKAAIVAGKRKGFCSRRQTAPSGRRSTSSAPPIPYGPSDDVVQYPAITLRKRGHDGSGSVDDAANKRRRPD